MKTIKTQLKRISGRYINILGMVLIIALMVVPSAVFADGPAVVDLGTAGNFVILACTGISATGVTSIVGDIGVSPYAATSITGFGTLPFGDATYTYSTSPLVTGRIYAADYADPTPADLGAAILDMGYAYADAAGRLLPDHSELYGGDLTGQTLIPGLYKWSSGVLISAGGVTIAGNADDIWIFQIAGNLTVANGAIVTLNGGAQPQNIFWQVAGQTTMGTSAQFKGIILCLTMISMNTSATINGRALAQTAVTLDGNAVNDPELAVKDVLTPNEFSLSQSSPNPFNPTTTIQFSIAKPAVVTIKVYDFMGREVATLANGAREAGQHVVIFDTDESFSSGIYLYRMEAENFVSVKRLILIK